jgi:hypothetical protein
MRENHHSLLFSLPNDDDFFCCCVRQNSRVEKEPPHQMEGDEKLRIANAFYGFLLFLFLTSAGFTAVHGALAGFWYTTIIGAVAFCLRTYIYKGDPEGPIRRALLAATTGEEGDAKPPGGAGGGNDTATEEKPRRLGKDVQGNGESDGGTGGTSAHAALRRQHVDDGIEASLLGGAAPRRKQRDVDDDLEEQAADV